MKTPIVGSWQALRRPRRSGLTRRRGPMLAGAQPLQREAVAEVVEHHPLERLRHRHARVAYRERRPLGDLLGKFPSPRQHTVRWQHLVYDTERKRLLR